MSCILEKIDLLYHETTHAFRHGMCTLWKLPIYEHITATKVLFWNLSFDLDVIYRFKCSTRYIYVICIDFLFLLYFCIPLSKYFFCNVYIYINFLFILYFSACLIYMYLTFSACYIGAVAGIAITMVLVGALLGVFITRLYHIKSYRRGLLNSNIEDY